ncbi:MAG: type II toxin-antitoxin system VapB family antitoxin [Devosia nanyangense]|uniref:Type II toxin-antitoxin system VapB family antitoxin n=1 Tax=Devosia nanyangense TaxID=1228055 RepID=A0A933KZZ3_9HYPH|nr:type II toxin-antitoxin system VapB family antitoxin [Devosia nanyangense]
MGRTNIDIDDELMAAAMRASGLKTKRAVVEEGLRIVARRERLRQAIENLAGIGWDAPPMQERHFAEDGTVYYDDEK